MSIDRAELLLERDALEQRLRKIRMDLATRLSPDLGGQAAELGNRDVLLEIARVTEEELVLINKKLQ